MSGARSQLQIRFMVGLGPPEEEKGPALPTRGLRRRAVQGLSICDYTVHMLSAALPNARPCAAQGCPQGSKHGPRPRPPAQKSCSQRRGERLHSLMSNIFLSCFLHFGCTEWLAGSWFPNQGWHPCPLKGKGGVLTTGQPGNSLGAVLNSLRS